MGDSIDPDQMTIAEYYKWLRKDAELPVLPDRSVTVVNLPESELNPRGAIVWSYDLPTGKITVEIRDPLGSDFALVHGWHRPVRIFRRYQLKEGGEIAELIIRATKFDEGAARRLIELAVQERGV